MKFFSFIMSTAEVSAKIRKIKNTVKAGKKKKKGSSQAARGDAESKESSLGNLTLEDAAATDGPGASDPDEDPSTSSATSSSESSDSSSGDDSRRRHKTKKKKKKKDRKHRYVEKDMKALKYYGRILAAGNKNTVLEVVEGHDWRGPGVYHQQRRNAQAIDAMVEQLGLERCSDILGFEILVRSTMGLFVSDQEGEPLLTEMYEWAPPQSFADPLSLRSKLKVVDRWNKAKNRRDKNRKGGAARGKSGARD